MKKFKKAHLAITTGDTGVNYTVKSALAPTNAVTTMLYVADEENVVEMVPQIPGQFGIAGTEQEAPPALKLVKFA